MTLMERVEARYPRRKNSHKKTNIFNDVGWCYALDRDARVEFWKVDCSMQRAGVLRCMLEEAKSRYVVPVFEIHGNVFALGPDQRLDSIWTALSIHGNVDAVVGNGIKSEDYTFPYTKPPKPKPRTRSGRVRRIIL